MSYLMFPDNESVWQGSSDSTTAGWAFGPEQTLGINPQLSPLAFQAGGGVSEVKIPTQTTDYTDALLVPDDLSLPTVSGQADGDWLTGEVASEVYEQLKEFAADPNFTDKMNLAFEDSWNVEVATALTKRWLAGDFSQMPALEVVSSANIAGGAGAFAAATDTIYISKEWLELNAFNLGAIAPVVLEEIGHYVDYEINMIDAPGDEGAIFAAVVGGEELTPAEVATLKAEDDTAVVVIGDLEVAIEKFDIESQWYAMAFPLEGWQPFVRDNPISMDNNFGTNDLGNGQKGFSANWGEGSPRPEIPDDNFALELWTQANFEAGKTYTFNVTSDDRYWIVGLPVNGDNPEVITEPGRFSEAYSGNVHEFRPQTTGKYWIGSLYYETEGDAYFDISWSEKQAPDNFTAIEGGKGVTLYESRDKNDYVQVVDLSQGASIELMSSEISYATVPGAYGGIEPMFERQSIQNFWEDLSRQEERAFSVTNGAFFEAFSSGNTPDLLAALSHPLKDNSTTYEGYVNPDRDPNNKNSKAMLKIWNDKDRVLLTDFQNNIDDIKNSSAPEILVGLKESSPSDGGVENERTFVGVKDANGDNLYEQLLILTSKQSTRTNAGQTLKDFGADEVMILDGSGSTQMIANDMEYVKSSDPLPFQFIAGGPRKIPQAIGVSRGQVTPRLTLVR
ncbi:MAG: phosphodiester glycosidase family protein [Cyanobacteriota bacterium]|nr:phosphodiester glycosidase family protein [Cyanobacteriota bacterium]